MDSFVHGNVFSLSINRSILVCTIQSNQTLDALIEYFALYHILYSGQLEISLSVGLCLCLTSSRHVYGWFIWMKPKLKR